MCHINATHCYCEICGPASSSSFLTMLELMAYLYINLWTAFLYIGHNIRRSIWARGYKQEFELSVAGTPLLPQWSMVEISSTSGVLSTLEQCSAGKFAVSYSRFLSFCKIKSQCGDIKLTVGPPQAVTSGIHTGQVLGVKHPEVPWGLENRVTFWGTLLWQNFQHRQVSEAATEQSRGCCCDLLLVLQRISLPCKDYSCRRQEKAELPAVLSFLPQQAL